jgi:hypothetical protein
MELRLRLPASFVLVPSDSPAAFTEWADKLVAAQRVGIGALAPTLRADLERLSAAIAASTELGRSWFAVIPLAPYRHGIGAIGWVRAGSAGGLTAGQLRAQADTAHEGRSTNSLVTDLSLHEVRAGTTLIMHQFQAVEASDSTALIERCGALMLDEERDVAVTVEITAVDLRTFEDVVSTLLEVLGSVSLRASAA